MFFSTLTSIETLKMRLKKFLLKSPCGNIDKFCLLRGDKNSDIPFTIVVYEKIFGSINNN